MREIDYKELYDQLCEQNDLLLNGIDFMQSRIEALEKDAARWRRFKENNHVRFSLFSGRYRADNGHSILTDWVESFDECFDTAMQSEKGGA